jgi:hypothetical protein
MLASSRLLPLKLFTSALKALNLPLTVEIIMCFTLKVTSLWLKSGAQVDTVVACADVVISYFFICWHKGQPLFGFHALNQIKK